MKRYTLTIGLNDKDTKQQEYDTITCYKMIEDVLQKYLEGYTIRENTKGYYKHEDGTETFEKSLDVIILFSNDFAIKVIVDNIKKVLNQETIAVQIEEINSQLW